MKVHEIDLTRDIEAKHCAWLGEYGNEERKYRTVFRGYPPLAEARENFTAYNPVEMHSAACEIRGKKKNQDYHKPWSGLGMFMSSWVIISSENECP